MSWAQNTRITAKGKAMAFIISLVELAISVLMFAGMWKTFEKAGKQLTKEQQDFRDAWLSSKVK